MEIDFKERSVIAHRGASFYAPENTMSAFVKAAQMGAKWIEFDVMQTKDGEVVVFHDEKLNRCTNGKGLVRSYSYDELKDLDCGAWFGSCYAGERILKLETLLSFLSSLSLCANIELKPSEGKESELVEAVLNIATPYLIRFNERFLFSSFSITALTKLRALTDKVNVGLLLHDYNENWHVQASLLDCISVHVNKNILTPSLIYDIKKLNKKIFVYTINHIKLAKQLFALGVDGVFSDKPDLLLS